MKRHPALYLVVAAIVLGSGYTVQHTLHNRSEAGVRTVTIGSTTITIEEAVTPAEQMKGLGGRDTLAPDHGMLFRLPPGEVAVFWMKGMRFPLDFLWIKDNKITEITDHVAAPISSLSDDQLPRYSPHQAEDAMIEVNAGFAQYYKIKAGDNVVGL